ncbi:MAG: hypothetical protein H6550_13570 [Chitinophagales bacterium]|nr:hypothetical protein [Chitinophagales bacterium]
MLNLGTFRYFFITLSICLVVASCGKKEEPPIEFKINGIKNITIQENGAEELTLDVELVSNNSEQITLSLENMPEGISPNFNRTTDKPPFTASLYLKDDSSKGGEYHPVLKGVSATGVEKSYEFTITTFEKTCALKAAGLYHGTSTCRNGTGENSDANNFVVDPNDKSKLYFTWWNGQTVYCTVNCNKKQIIIPKQYVGTYTLSGEGFMDQNYTIIDFDYTQRFSNGDTLSCYAHFFKK